MYAYARDKKTCLLHVHVQICALVYPKLGRTRMITISNKDQHS